MSDLNAREKGPRRERPLDLERNFWKVPAGARCLKLIQSELSAYLGAHIPLSEQLSFVKTALDYMDCSLGHVKINHVKFTGSI